MTENSDFLAIDWSINRTMTKKADVFPDRHTIEMGDRLALPCVYQSFAFLHDAFISVPER